MTDAVRQSDEASAPSLSNVDGQLVEALERRGSDPDFWSSRARDRSDSAHCIFQYPAMMVPLVQRRLLATLLDVQSDAASIYDPFAGSGTSLVSGMHYGLDVHGADINPLAILIARVRTSLSVEFTVGSMAREVAGVARRDGRTRIESEMPNLEKWFAPDVSIALSKLRRAIRRCDNVWARQFFWITLAETVRLTSNDRTSTYKLHMRPAEEIAARRLSPIDVFEQLALINADSFLFFRKKLRDAQRLRNGRYDGHVQVELADSRTDIERWRGRAPFDILMTSPPYGDNQTTVTYGQHSYLPLNWIDLWDIDRGIDPTILRTTQEIDRRSLGGRDLVGPDDEASLFEASPALKSFAEHLPTTPVDGRARLLRFYRDFRTSLTACVGLMRQNAYMVWTVGNRSIGGQQVPTDAILRELMTQESCQTVTTLTRRIHHKRMPDRNASSATMREEKILLIRRN